MEQVWSLILFSFIYFLFSLFCFGEFQLPPATLCRCLDFAQETFFGAENAEISRLTPLIVKGQFSSPFDGRCSCLWMQRAHF
jgi:hypothetical protein